MKRALTLTAASLALVAAGLAPGAKVDLAGTVKWVVCREVCIPGKTEVSLSLPVLRDAAPQPSKVFDDARERIPQPAPAHWRARARSPTPGWGGPAPPTAAPARPAPRPRGCGAAVPAGPGRPR